MIYKDDFKKHGWIILKDFFSKETAEQIRLATERSIKENIRIDLLCNPYLKDLTVLNKDIIKVVKELLGEQPVYIGDSSISYNDRGVSLHKDNPDRFDSKAPDWTSYYTVLRMGIYMRDYTSDSGGLILRDQSHNTISRHSGKIINVKSTPTDLIIWNLRTTHSGNAKRLKMAPGLDLNPYVCKVLPEFLFKPAPESRMALFLSYGKDDAHMKRYIQYLKTRKYAIDRWQKMNLTDDLVNQGRAAGVNILKIAHEVTAVDINKLNEQHVELPY